VYTNMLISELSVGECGVIDIGEWEESISKHTAQEMVKPIAWEQGSQSFISRCERHHLGPYY